MTSACGRHAREIGLAAKVRSPTSRKTAQAAIAAPVDHEPMPGHDEDRAADVDDLEQGALHRVRGVAAVRAVEQHRPQRAHARAHRGLGCAGDRRRGEDRAERGTVGEGGQDDDRGGRQRRPEAQDERLPAAVDDAREGRV